MLLYKGGSGVKNEQMDELLRSTLADGRVSRGEKKVLVDMVREWGGSEQKLGLLQQRAFAVARSEVVGPEAIKVLGWLEEAIKVFRPPPAVVRQDSGAYFSPQDDCPRILRRLMESASHSIDICVFTITDNRVSDAIMKAHDRGVKVRVLSDDDKALDLGSDIAGLSRHGIPVRVDDSRHHMHHKYAIFDDSQLLTGSYNWTRSAAEYNEENFIVTSEPRIRSSFQGHFQRLWDKLGEGHDD